jgi:hypothetical protein
MQEAPASRYIPEEKQFGRPTKYNPSYCQQIIEYFSAPLTKNLKKTYTTKAGTVIEEDVEKGSEFPTIDEFSAKILGVDDTTLINWTREHPEFLAAYTRAKQLQRDFLIKNGLQERYNSQFAIFVAKNCCGMTDKSEVVLSGNAAAPLVMLLVEEPQKPTIDVTPNPTSIEE